MIIQRYLFREIMSSFLATLFVLLLIIVGNTFVRLLASVSNGSLPVDVLGKLIFLGSINGAIKLVPVALLIGMMLAFGRLYRDQEMTALHATGVGPKLFYKGIFLFVGPLTLLIAILVLLVNPVLERTTQNIKNEIRQRPEASGIPVGEFMHSRVGKKRFTIFVEELDKEKVVMERFFMHVENRDTAFEKNRHADIKQNNTKADDADEIDDADDIETILTAQKALLYIDQNTGERVLKINNGSRYDNKRSSGEFLVFNFAEHGIHVPALKIKINKSLEAVSTLELLKKYDRKSQAELQWRLSLIFSAPVMALLAFPLSYTTPRQGRFGKLALGILLYAIYANLIITGKTMLEDGRIPTWLGLWWTHLIFILLALWLVRKQYGSSGKIACENT